MGLEEMGEYRELKQKNACLKRLIADRELEIEAMKDLMRKETMAPQARRNYVQAMIELQVSKRRSSQLVGMARSAYQRLSNSRTG